MDPYWTFVKLIFEVLTRQIISGWQNQSPYKISSEISVPGQIHRGEIWYLPYYFKFFIAKTIHELWTKEVAIKMRLNPRIYTLSLGNSIL